MRISLEVVYVVDSFHATEHQPTVKIRKTKRDKIITVFSIQFSQFQFSQQLQFDSL